MKKFTLSDLMTAEQAVQIIDLLNQQQQKIADLEKEVENLKNGQANLAWKDIYTQTEIYQIYGKGE